MRDPIAPCAGSIRSDAPLVELAGAGLLADVLFSPRATWTDPGTAAAATAALAVPGLAVGDLGEWWSCNDPAGSMSVAGLRGLNLQVADETAVVGQRAIGIFNGIDFKSLRAIEAIGPDSGFYGPSPDYFDPGSGNFAILIAFRVAQRGGAQSSLIGRTSFGHGAGYCLYLETDGTITWRVRGTGGDRTRTLAGNHADGAWHFVAAYRSGGTIGVYSDLTAEVTTVGATGDITTAGWYFAIGAVHGGTVAAYQQTKCAAYWNGASLAGARTSMLAWWATMVTHGSDALTVTRASSLMSPVGTSSAGILASIAAIGAPAPYYMPSQDGDYGIAFAPAFTSIVTYSNPADTAGWSRLSTPTVTERYADDMRGVRQAVRLAKSAGNPTGRLSTSVALTSGQIYHFAVGLFWSGAGTLPPTVRIRDAGDTATLATVAATNAAGAWHWLILTYTATATATHLLQVLASPVADDTSTDVVLVQYVSGGLGASHQPLPALARGGTVANVVTTAVLAPGDSGLIGRASRGRMEVTAVATIPGSAMAAERGFGALVGTTSMLRCISVTAARLYRARLFNDAGTGITMSLLTLLESDLATVHRYAMRWDRAVALMGQVTATGQLDGVDLATSITVFDEATDPTRLVVGAAGLAGSLCWLGGISRARVWSIAWDTPPPVMV